MYKPEFVQENELYKILSDFEIQMDHLIPTGRPDLVVINKKKDFAVPTDHKIELKESEKKDKCLDLYIKKI